MNHTPLPATAAEMRRWVERLELDLVRQYAGQRPDLPTDFWRAVAVARQRLRLMEQIEAVPIPYDHQTHLNPQLSAGILSLDAQASGQCGGS